MKNKEEIKTFKDEIKEYLTKIFKMKLNGLYSVVIELKETNEQIDIVKTYDYIEDNFDVNFVENHVEDAVQDWVNEQMVSIEGVDFDEGSKERIFKFIDKKFRAKIKFKDGMISAVSIANGADKSTSNIHDEIIKTYGLAQEETSSIVRAWIEHKEAEIRKRMKGVDFCTQMCI